MEQQIDLLVTDVQKLTPSTNRSDIVSLVTQMSQRSGISMEKLLLFLYEDLRNGIPVRYTAVGKSSSLAWR